MEEYKRIGSAVVCPQDLGLYEGLLPVILEEIKEVPLIKWKGAKISAEMWNQIVSFMNWTYAEYKSESQLRLFYNQGTNEWGVGVLPQHVDTGMSSKEIGDHEGRAEVFALFPSDAGWREAGTVHHHCSSSAFQSGIDLADERDKNGLHITLGGMGNSEWHGFHARASFRKVMYDVTPAEWIDGTIDPDGVMPNRLVTAASAVPFPEFWKKYLIIKPKQVYAPSKWGGYNARTLNSDAFDSVESYYRGAIEGWDNAPCWSFDEADLSDIEQEFGLTPEDIEQLNNIVIDIESELSISPEKLGMEHTIEYVELLEGVINNLNDLRCPEITYAGFIADLRAMLFDPETLKRLGNNVFHFQDELRMMDEVLGSAKTGDDKDATVSVSTGCEPAFAGFAT